MKPPTSFESLPPEISETIYRLITPPSRIILKSIKSFEDINLCDYSGSGANAIFQYKYSNFRIAREATQVLISQSVVIVDELKFHERNVLSKLSALSILPLQDSSPPLKGTPMSAPLDSISRLNLAFQRLEVRNGTARQLLLDLPRIEQLHSLDIALLQQHSGTLSHYHRLEEDIRAESHEILRLESMLLELKMGSPKARTVSVYFAGYVDDEQVALYWGVEAEWVMAMWKFASWENSEMGGKEGKGLVGQFRDCILKFEGPGTLLVYRMDERKKSKVRDVIGREVPKDLDLAGS